MQTRKASAIEAVTNTAIGWTINFTANIVFLPLLYRPDHNVRSAFLIGVVFTAISLTRQYILRRYFNGLKFGNEAKA
jgi:hypothetical protein